MKYGLRFVCHRLRVFFTGNPCPEQCLTPWKNLGMRDDHGDWCHDVYASTCKVCGIPHVCEMGSYFVGYPPRTTCPPLEGLKDAPPNR